MFIFNYLFFGLYQEFSKSFANDIQDAIDMKKKPC